MSVIEDPEGSAASWMNMEFTYRHTLTAINNTFSKFWEEYKWVMLARG